MQFAEKFGISERTARNYCAGGKIEGAFLTGKTWNIPANAALPQRGAAKKVSPLLVALRVYYRGLREWGHINGFLTDTCLTAQDQYKSLLNYFNITYK